MKLQVRCPFCDKVLSTRGFAGHVSGKHPLEWYQIKHEGNDIAHLCDVARERFRGKSLRFQKTDEQPISAKKIITPDDIARLFNKS